MSPHRSSDWLGAETAEHLVGVIDLKDGHAVHAVAGQRSQYKLAKFGDQPTAGDALGLARHYWQLGIRRLYIADLDSIVHGQLQHELLDRLIDQGFPWQEMLIDFGWRASDNAATTNFTSKIATAQPHISVIAATETAEHLGSLRRLADLIDPQRILLGLDYRSGRFVGSDALDADWIEAAIAQCITSAVILDVNSVGTGVIESATRLCGRIAAQYPQLTLYSGGGIRSADDVIALRQAGCDFCLAATSLH